MNKIKKVLSLIWLAIKITIWTIKVSAKWFWRATPKTELGFYRLIFLLIINYVIGIYGLIPVTSAYFEPLLKQNERIVVEKQIVVIEKEIINTDAISGELLDYVMSLEWKVKRNNPGNLRCANQPYAGCENGFAVFPNIVVGFQALVNQVKLDQSREFTLAEFINKYSPPEENDTPWLIKCASKEFNISYDTPIKYIDPIVLAKYMVKQEYSISY